MNRAPLCALADIPDGGTRLFLTADPRTPNFFLVRRGDRVCGYVNDCPHWNAPLDLAPGRVLTPDGAWILCTNHGALFDIDTGRCVSGPCGGQSLARVPLTVADDMVHLAADTAGRWRLSAAGAPPMMDAAAVYRHHRP